MVVSLTSCISMTPTPATTVSAPAEATTKSISVTLPASETLLLVPIDEITATELPSNTAILAPLDTLPVSAIPTEVRALELSTATVVLASLDIFTDLPTDTLVLVSEDALDTSSTSIGNLVVNNSTVLTEPLFLQPENIFPGESVTTVTWTSIQPQFSGGQITATGSCFPLCASGDPEDDLCALRPCMCGVWPFRYCCACN